MVSYILYCYYIGVHGLGTHERSLYSDWRRKSGVDAATGWDQPWAGSLGQRRCVTVCNVHFHSGRSSPSVQRVSAQRRFTQRHCSWYTLPYHRRSIITARSTVVRSRQPGVALRALYWDVMVVDDEKQRSPWAGARRHGQGGGGHLLPP